MKSAETPARRETHVSLHNGRSVTEVRVDLKNLDPGQEVRVDGGRGRATTVFISCLTTSTPPFLISHLSLCCYTLSYLSTSIRDRSDILERRKSLTRHSRTHDVVRL